jgi:dsDNA-binding SOS-regulon protein
LIRVTALGGRLLEKAIPAWEQAQQEATALLGAQDVSALGRVAKSLRSSGVQNVN